MSRVSIGLPVFNGQRFLKEALDSILCQTFEDFELIISDNASTDRTEHICREYAASDRRIRYYRKEQNLGAASNFNFVFELSIGEYFKWASHDDVCANDFLLQCVQALDNDFSVALSHSKVRVIDENGNHLQDYDTGKLSLNSPNPRNRFASIILDNHPCYEVFGLIRSSLLRKTPLIGSYILSDKNLLAELSLLGRFYEIPDYLFLSRKHVRQSITKKPHERAKWFDATKGDRIIFPYWRILFEHFKSINRVPISSYERICCYKHLGRWLLKRWKFLGGDLRIAAKHIITSF